VSAVQRCAGAVVLDGSRRLLMVRRAHDPGRGLWTIPGGRCLDGESTRDACVREVREETGLDVLVGRELGRVSRAGVEGVVYDITDYECTVSGGALCAGDDADEARWVSRADFDALPVIAQLRDYLAEHNLLPT
jgi:ADP-ribose pyrophosphatase YjhB (NUDIX family)